MLAPRSLRSPRTPKSGNKQDFEGILLFKYDFRDDEPVKVKIPKQNPKQPESIQDILTIATRSLNLNRPALSLYDEKGKPLEKYSDIQVNMKIYVSCTPLPSTEIDDKDIYPSRLPKYAPHFRRLPNVKQPEYKPKPEDSQQHMAIAASQYTVKENLRDSLLSLYNSLSPAHKAQLPCSPALQKLTNDTQQYLVEDSLLSQFIGPTSVINDTPLGQQTTEWAMEKLKGLTPEECRFAITGPTQSGKSTLLNILVSLFFQKLQLSNETQNYLIFPLNWQLQQIYIEDVAKLYGLVISTTLNSLRCSQMKYIPLINVLHQWLLSIIEMPVFPTLPPQVQRFPNFPAAALNQLCQRIHKAWNSPKGFEEFLQLLFAFPDSFAKAFGFKSAVYILDHYDACCLALTAPEKFEQARNPVSIPACIEKVLQNTPFFVASLNDVEFFNYFTLDCTQLSTEHLIDQKGEVQLLLADPKFTLSMELCNGCPGYCALYARLVKLAQDTQEKAAVKGQFAKLRSVVDISRQEMLKQEFCRLCLLIKEASDESIDGETMSLISEKDELDITIH